MTSVIRAATWLAAIFSMAAVLVPSQAVAAPPDPVAFYDAPTDMSGKAPGDVLRSEPMPLPVLRPLVDATGTRIMYRTTDAHGNPAAGTGTVLEPARPWTGPGPRPVVSLAVGTHGIGPQCRPSQLLGVVVDSEPPRTPFAEYETVTLALLLGRGMAVAVTDYLPDSYVISNAEAHAVIDAARAAGRLGLPDVGPTSPVAFWGYSQGGHAVGAAAEQVSSYAPEMNLRGAYVGSAPADLTETLNYAEGTSLTGVNGYVLNSLSTTYPETAPAIDRILDDAGRSMMHATTVQCAAEIALNYGFHRSSEYTVDGSSVPSALAADPIVGPAVSAQRLGDSAPSTPVFAVTGNADEVDPQGMRRLAGQWCAAGARVELLDVPLPKILPGLLIGHVADAATGALGGGLQWLTDRFAGAPAPDNCAAHR
ncbi:lipase family protein [Nocardia nova]|uniref:lipase family protein n=1 Tax=Nocardia nova TaxID=37330 RepID=UPI0033D9D9B7